MSETFTQNKIIENIWTWPYTVVPWPGLDGCAGRSLVRSATTPSTVGEGTTYSYEPESVSRWRQTSPLSGKTGGSPPYRMTPYSVGTLTTRQYIIKLSTKATVGMMQWWQAGHVAKAPLN